MSVSNEYHGKRLMFPGTSDKSQLEKFLSRMPKRTDFVDPISKTIDKAVAKNGEILFLPNDLIEEHIFDKQTRRRAYKLILMGVLEGGMKAAVILNGIDVFFDVRVPEDADPDKFIETVKKTLNDAELSFKSVKQVDQYPFKLFHEKPVPYMRIHFDTLYDRKKAITLFRNNKVSYFNKKGARVYVEGLETAADDTSCYYRKVAREYKFKLAGWNLIKKYQLAPPEKYTKELCYSYTFEVNIHDFVDIEKIQNFQENFDPKAHPDLQKDKSLVMCWDLETDDLKPTGNAPDPNDVFDQDGQPRAVIELECCSFHWQYSKDPLLVVAISVMPVPIRNDCLSIQVRNQIDIIKVKALITERMAPEFLTGFNDGTYDWPFINRRVEMYDKQEGKKIHEFMKAHMSSVPYVKSPGKNGKVWENVTGIHEEKRIKVEADSYLDIENFEAPGFICIDTRTIFRQMFPTAEKTSLNFFLAISKLGSKADMDYIIMFKIFRLMRHLVQKFKTRDFEKIKTMFMAIMATKGDDHCPLKDNDDGLSSNDVYDVTKLNCKDMLVLIELVTDVIHYCNVDARRCQELLNVRSVIPDKREVVNLSYTSMHDGFYRAGGMKVRNMVIAVGIEQQWNLAISNISTGNKTEKKYPGAWVVPPTKGLYRDHKITKRNRRRQTGGNEGIGVCNRFPYEEINPQDPNFKKELLDDEKCGDADIDSIRKPEFESVISSDLDDRCDRPCTGLDFSSLYPSLIRAYNLSPEKIVLDDKYAEELRVKGYVLHEINFRYGYDNQAEEDKELIHGYSVRHIPKKEIGKNGKATWTYDGMGIYPYILDDLFNKRKVVKGRQDHYGHPKEWMEGVMKDKNFIALGENAALQHPFVRAVLEKDISDKTAFIEANKGSRKAKYFEGQIYCTKQVKKFFEEEGFFANDSTKTLQSLYPEVSFWWNYYNTKQLALKVFMNTFYGETGNSLSPFFLVHVAGGITMGGQWNIKYVRDFVLQNGYQVLYGDSVPEDEPVLCRRENGQITYQTIDEISDGYWNEFPNAEKEWAFTEEPLWSWTDSGWTLIRRVIRHKTNKNLYRILTHTGCVDVTEDHSLLKPNGEEITPNEVSLGTSLMHKNLPEIPELDDNYDLEELKAYVYGLFFAEGSCGYYECPSGKKHSWAISNQNLDYLNKAKECLECFELECEFKILDTMESSAAYKLVPTGNVKDIVNRWRKMFYDKRKYKKVPDEMLNAPFTVRKAFWEGYYDGDGDKEQRKGVNANNRCSNKGKIGSAGLYFIMNSLGNDVSINIRTDKMEIYQMTASQTYMRKDKTKIKKIIKLPKTSQYVYDLETENHHFSAGIGRMIVHNTDSLYICCPERCFEELDRQYISGEIDRLQYWTRMVEITMETIDDFKDAVNAYLEANNGTPFLTMAYEEVLWPYALVGKKKYIGIQHMGIVNFAICMPECTLEDFMKSKSLFIRGLEVKKRGSSEFLKLVCFEIFKRAFCITQTLTLREIVEQQIAEVAQKKWDPKLFIKTARYKLPTGDKPGNVTVLGFVDRMRQIEDNNPELGIKVPEIGERFQYVVTKKYPWAYDVRGRQTAIKIGDKYEFYDSMNNKAYQEHLGTELELDMDYYMLNEIIGQFGRFIVYHPYYDKFGPAKAKDDWTDEEYEQADKKAITFAKKTLQEYYKQNFAAKYEKRGKIYQGVFKEVDSRLSDWNREQYGDASILFDITKTLTSGADEESINTQRYEDQLRMKIMKEADKMAVKGAKSRVQARIKELTNKRKKDGISAQELYRLYVTAPNAIFKIQNDVMSEQLRVAEKRLKETIPEYKRICMENTEVLTTLINEVRKGQDGKTPVTDFKIVDRGIKYVQKNGTNRKDLEEFLKAIDEYESEDEKDEPEDERGEFIYDMFDVFAKIVAVKRVMIENELMKEYLNYTKKTKVGVIAKPPDYNAKNTAEDYEEWQKRRLVKKDPLMDLP